MLKLLALAELLCGDRTRYRVFDALVADWQRELTDARHRGRLPCAIAVAA